ncbi:MAG: cytochrome c [Planctomycetes bacterium]|nr:cytochrome c [Planctomycetota bacterium]
MKHALRPTLLGALLLTATLSTFASCRGGISEDPPVHLVLDMDFQQKVKTQSKSEFYPDHRGMRLPVTDANGRVAVISRRPLPDPAMSNRDASNAFVTANPVPVSSEVLERGQKLFDINCAICHGYTGQGGNGVHGNGLVGRRWPVVIPNFHFQENKSEADNRVALLSEGEYFEVITNGKGTMPAYGPRIDVEDRWAIVHYIRVLQSLSR